MKSKITVALSLPIAVVLMITAAQAQDCIVDKCEMVLTVAAGSTAYHLVEGDTLKLVYDGNNRKTVLIPSATDWEGAPIHLKEKVIWQPGKKKGEGRLVLAWEFKFKSKANHVPKDKDHLEVHLYKDPDSAGKNWVLKDGKHSNNQPHGGTAHMTQ